MILIPQTFTKYTINYKYNKINRLRISIKTAFSINKFKFYISYRYEMKYLLIQIVQLI